MSECWWDESQEGHCQQEKVRCQRTKVIINIQRCLWMSLSLLPSGNMFLDTLHGESGVGSTSRRPWGRTFDGIPPPLPFWRSTPLNCRCIQMLHKSYQYYQFFCVHTCQRKTFQGHPNSSLTFAPLYTPAIPNVRMQRMTHQPIMLSGQCISFRHF